MNGGSSCGWRSWPWWRWPAEACSSIWSEPSLAAVIRCSSSTSLTRAACTAGCAGPKLAGVVVGRVRAVELLPNRRDPAGKPLPIRIEAGLRADVLAAMHKDARIGVAMQGALGEPFIEVSTGSAEAPLLHAGEVVRGVDPPRLDLLLAMQLDDLVSGAHALLEQQRPRAGQSADGGRQPTSRRSADRFLVENKDALTATLQARSAERPPMPARSSCQAKDHPRQRQDPEHARRRPGPREHAAPGRAAAHPRRPAAHAERHQHGGQLRSLPMAPSFKSAIARTTRPRASISESIATRADGLVARIEVLAKAPSARLVKDPAGLLRPQGAGERPQASTRGRCSGSSGPAPTNLDKSPPA